MPIITQQSAVPTTAAVAPIQADPPKQEAAPAVEPSPEQLSPKFAALARQQKMLRRQQLELKAREDALKSRESDYQTNYIPKSKLIEDPYRTITEAGVPYDNVVNAALQQDPQSERIKKLEAEIESMKSGQVKASEEAKARQDESYKRAVNNIREEITQLVDVDTSYEAIKANSAVEAVVSLIEETFAETGKILSSEDAAKQVEDYLIEEAIKLANLSKVKQRLAPPPAESAPQKQQPGIRTLTNASTTLASKPLTAAERRARAIAVFKGEAV